MSALLAASPFLTTLAILLCGIGYALALPPFPFGFLGWLVLIPFWAVIEGRTGRKALWLGFAGGLISRLFRTPLPDVTTEDWRRHDYSASTQRMGVRFTERIRNTFRLRWIREIF